MRKTFSHPEYNKVW